MESLLWTCRRCKQVLPESVEERHAGPSAWVVAVPDQKKGYAVARRDVSYHVKCLPPNMFHRIYKTADV